MESIYNFPGLIEDFKPEPLPLEWDPLTTASCNFHIYCYNYSSSKIITNCITNLLQIMAAQTSSNHWWLLLFISQNYYKLHYKFTTNYGSSNFLQSLVVITNTEQRMKRGIGHIYWRNPWRKTSFLCSEIAVTLITNYGRFLKLSQTTLKIIANYGRYCKLRHFYKLRRNRVIFWSDATDASSHDDDDLNGFLVRYCW